MVAVNCDAAFDFGEAARELRNDMAEAKIDGGMDGVDFVGLDSSRGGRMKPSASAATTMSLADVFIGKVGWMI